MRGACNKLPVLSGQCKFLDNEFIPSNLVTFESYLLDIFSSIASCLSTEQFFMILELPGVKRNVIETVYHPLPKHPVGPTDGSRGKWIQTVFTRHGCHSYLHLPYDITEI